MMTALRTTCEVFTIGLVSYLLFGDRGPSIAACCIVIYCCIIYLTRPRGEPGENS